MTGSGGAGLGRGDWDTEGAGMGKRGLGETGGTGVWAGERAAEVIWGVLGVAGLAGGVLWGTGSTGVGGAGLGMVVLGRMGVLDRAGEWRS